MRHSSFSMACLGLVLVLLLSLVGAALAQPGELDASFDGDGFVLTNLTKNTTRVNAVAVDANGMILAVGSVRNGYETDMLVARYQPDGRLDGSFQNLGYLTLDFAGGSEAAWDLALQADEKIVVVGDAGGDFAVARYHPDGSLDSTFSADGTMTIGFGGSDYARAVAMAADGKIIVAGRSGGYFALARLHPDGSLDATFDGDGMLAQYIGSSESSGANSVAIQADGKIISAGYSWDEDYRLTMVRFNPDGSLDDAFGTGGVVTTGCDEYCEWEEVLVQTDGKLVGVGVDFAANMGGFVLARYLADGSLDMSFGLGGVVQTQPGGHPSGANDAALLPDGKILAVGYAEVDLGYGMALARYLPDGSLDAGFDADGVVVTLSDQQNLIAYGVAIDGGDQAIVAGVGSGNNFYEADQLALATYLPDGSLNEAFGVDGLVLAGFGRGHDYARAVVLQPDGKIITAGDAYNWAGLARYQPDGSLDASFGEGGVVINKLDGEWTSAEATLLQPDSKILLLGLKIYNPSFFLARYHPDGSLDQSFGVNGMVELPIVDAIGEDIALQADGKIILAGNLRSTAFVARFLEDGSLDPSFGGTGWRAVSLADDHIITTVLVQPDGKILLAGSAGNTSGDLDFGVIRFNPDSSLDTTFSGDGIALLDLGAVGSSDYAADAALQPDGKILLAGYSFTNLDGIEDMLVARVNADGSLDAGFDGDGFALIDFDGGIDGASAIALQADGKIVVVGDSDDLLAAARCQANGSLDPSFGNGGKVRIALDPVTRFLASDALIQPMDGKIVVAGSGLMGDEGDHWDFALARIQTANEGTATLLDGETSSLGETGVSIRLNSGGPCTFTAVKVPVPPGGSPAIFGELPVHWEIGASCSPLDYDLVLSYTEDELASGKGILESFLRPVLSVDGGLTWEAQVGEVDAAANSVTVRGVTTSGQWGMFTRAPSMFWLPFIGRSN